MTSLSNGPRAMLLIVVMLGAASSGPGQPAPAGQDTRVGVLLDNYPFSFRGANGRTQGFAYDLLKEIEQVMSLRFQRVEGSTQEINGAFQAGRVDLLQSFARSPDREAAAEFSVPYLNMEGVVFVRDGGLVVKTPADLKSRKVLVHRGSLGEQWLQRSGLAETITYVDSVEQAMVMLNRGDADATLATRLTGLALAHHLGLTRVQVAVAKIDGYDVSYCFAVQKGNHGLLSRINEGMAILVRTGKFDELYRKWFGVVVPVGYSTEQMLLGVAIGLAMALLVAIWAVVRQRALRKRIARQAETLRESEERFVAIFKAAPGSMMLFSLPEGKAIEVNDQFSLITGYTREEALGKDTADLGMWVDPQARETFLTLLQKNGSVSDFEADLKHKSGAICNGLASGHIITLRGRSYLLGVFFDITERKRASAAVLESEQRLRSVLDTMFVFVGLLTLEGRIVEVNEAPLKAAGLTREDVLGRTVAESYWFSYSATVQAQVGLALSRIAHGEIVREDFPIRIADGRIITIDTTFAPLRDAAGQVTLIVASAVDVTARKQAEEALQESELRLRTIIQNEPACVKLVAADGRLLEMNPAGLAMLGAESLDQLRGLPLVEVITAEHRAAFARLHAAVMRGESGTLQFEVIGLKGARRWLETHAVPMREADGRVTTLLGLTRDITEHKRSTEALRESEERFRQLAENIQEVFWLNSSEQNQILYISPAYEAIWGRSCQSLYASPRAWMESIHPEDRERVAFAVATKQKEGNYKEEYRILQPNGAVRWIQDQAFPVRDGAGTVHRIAGVATDITDRKLAEQKLAESREQLRALLARLQHTREEERIRVSREIHDELGQLLTGLKMDVRWLERKLSDPSLPPAFNLLLDRAVAASELADATIATVQKIAAELRPGALDQLGLAAALTQEARRFQERSGVQSTMVVTESWPALLPPRVATELFYICQEALTNVARHAGAKNVDIRLTSEGDAAILEVGDDGVGMSESNANAPSSLGLIGMKERAAQCGGTITFARNEPHGMRVSVRVSLAGQRVTRERSGTRLI